MTRREAAEFFLKYGNVGRDADDLLDNEPTPAQLDEASRRAEMRGRPIAEVMEARRAILSTGPTPEPAPQYTHILVRCGNPYALDTTLQGLCVGSPMLKSACLVAARVGGYATHDGHYIIRMAGNPGFLEFAIKNQGYGTVVGRLSDVACPTCSGTGKSHLHGDPQVRCVACHGTGKI